MSNPSRAAACVRRSPISFTALNTCSSTAIVHAVASSRAARMPAISLLIQNSSNGLLVKIRWVVSSIPRPGILQPAFAGNVARRYPGWRKAAARLLFLQAHSMTTRKLNLSRIYTGIPGPPGAKRWKRCHNTTSYRLARRKVSFSA